MKRYIDDNKKKPLQRDKNENVKKLGICNQQKNYNKKITRMKNNEIKKEYENFINLDNYGKYF